MNNNSDRRLLIIIVGAVLLSFGTFGIGFNTGRADEASMREEIRKEIQAELAKETDDEKEAMRKAIGTWQPSSEGKKR